MKPHAQALPHSPAQSRVADVRWWGGKEREGLAKRERIGQGSNFYRSGGGARKGRMVTRRGATVPGTTALFAERASTGGKPGDTSP